MATYVLSTNLYTFAQAHQGFFAWPDGTGEAETIRGLDVGDVIVPKFSQSASFGGREDELEWQRRYCEAIEVDPSEVQTKYEEVVAGGTGAVPFLLKVTGGLGEDSRSGQPWISVPVEQEELEHPISSQDFLLLRELPIEIAAQFKGTVAPGRHLQPVSDSLVSSVREAGTTDDRTGLQRRYSLVEATTPEAAGSLLANANRGPDPGDRVFIASPGGLLGVHEAKVDGTLEPVGTTIPKTPDELLELFQEAKSKARDQDQFTPNRAIAAAKELKELLNGPNVMVPIDDFGRFHDRYNLLAKKVTQAHTIAQRTAVVPTPAAEDAETDPTEPESAEVDELAALQGLSIDAVRKELPDNMVLPDSVLAEVVTALRGGKHLLLGGPPGTGKSTLAEAICRAVVGQQYEVVTGTADWTTFDTIGGYVPRSTGQGLDFEPGVVLRCLQRGAWLVIDELNRADIDKAFGPLFTLLAGSGDDLPNRQVVLPFQRGGRSVEIKWAKERLGTSTEFLLTPGWRLIGTLNLSDKATLFQLSFAFLRRFAVIDVPLPDRSSYEEFFGGLCTEVPDEARDKIVVAAIELAFGPRLLGPAILKDVAGFLEQGLAITASGQPTYADPVTAFATAIRLYGVPQYEGATGTEIAEVTKVFRSVWPERATDEWAALVEALNAVALA